MDISTCNSLTCNVGMVILLLLTSLTHHSCQGLHLTGTFSNQDFFKFLVKFGFQEVDKKDIETTQGFIYGKVTAADGYDDMGYDMYLVLVDSQYFIQYYAAKDNDESPKKCTTMFQFIDEKAWDRYCAVHGEEDFLRRIPCPEIGRAHV